MLNSKIEELKTKVKEAKDSLLIAVKNEYSYASTIAELAGEFVTLLAQLEILEELEDYRQGEQEG